MRRNLFKYVNQELWFEGTVEKFSFRCQKEKHPFSIYHDVQLYPTVLISDVQTYNDDIHIDHFWIIIPLKEGVIMKMKTGNRIKFKAKVVEYVKRNRYRDVGIDDNIKRVKTLGIDEKYKNIEREDFLNWWFQERYRHNITALCFDYDEIVLKCKRKKFFQKKKKREILNQVGAKNK